MSTVKIKLKNKQITAKLIPDKTNDKVMFIHKFLEIPKQIEACYIFTLLYHHQFVLSISSHIVFTKK